MATPVGSKFEGRRQAAVLECAFFNIRAASRRITKRYDEILAPSGLLTSQIGLMRVIAAKPGCGAVDIAERIDMDVSTVTRNLRPLVTSGHVVIRPDSSDGRRREVRLTAKGKRTLDKAMKLWEIAQSELVDELGVRRYENLITLVQAVR